MLTADQLKNFVNSVIDLQRDNFIELLNNPEFQDNDLKNKEKTIHYICELLKTHVQSSIQSLASKSAI